MCFLDKKKLEKRKSNERFLYKAINETDQTKI